MTYVNAWRPWMALYGVRIKNETKQVDKPLSLIEEMLPDEMLLHIFKHLSVTNLAIAQCVCHQWRYVGASPSLWRNACMDAFFKDNKPADLDFAAVLKPYRGSWKRMFIEKPHLRFDGIYVSRNTYIKTGVAEWRVYNPVHLVCYFRYIRFLPNGRFLYRTSPETVSKISKTMQLNSNGTLKPTAQKAVQQGRYLLDKERIFTALQYENSTSTEIRSRLKLRSTVPGANNRLDIETIFSWDREDGRAMPMADVRTDEEEAEGVQQRRYSRGMSPYVFVPWEKVGTSIFNLPISEMDVYIPG